MVEFSRGFDVDSASALQSLVEGALCEQHLYMPWVVALAVVVGSLRAVNLTAICTLEMVLVVVP